MKEFLSHQGVAFEDRNVSKNRQHLDEIRQMGFAGVPVTVIGGKRILGFDKRKIEQALSALEG